MFFKCRGFGFLYWLDPKSINLSGLRIMDHAVEDWAMGTANQNLVFLTPASPSTTEEREEALQKGNRRKKDNVKLSNDANQTAEQQRR